jgi:hypothetical protein
MNLAAHFLIPLLFLASCKFTFAGDHPVSVADDPTGTCQSCHKKLGNISHQTFDSVEPPAEYNLELHIIGHGKSGMVSILLPFSQVRRKM